MPSSSSRDHDREHKSSKSSKDSHRSSSKRHDRDDRPRDSKHSHSSRHRSRSRSGDEHGGEDDDQRRERKKRRKEEQDRHGHRREHKHESSKDRHSRGKDRDGEATDAQDAIPTSASLDLRSMATPSTASDPVPLQRDSVTHSELKRDDWMMSGLGASKGEPADDGGQPPDAQAQDGAFFSGLGQERAKKPKEDKPDPEKLKIHSKELNHQLLEGKTVDQYADQAKQKLAPGAPGHQWRMMKLRRVYETAEEEKRPVEEVALERYESMEAFNEARSERQYLDDRAKGRNTGGSNSSGYNTPTQQGGARARTFMFADSPGSTSFGGQPSRPSSRQSFRKPGESSAPSTPQPSASGMLPSGPSIANRLDSLRQTGTSETPSSSRAAPSKPGTPIPSVFTPTHLTSRGDAASRDPAAPSSAVRSAVAASSARDADETPPLDATALNKLEARVMRAELMKAPDAAELREELERQTARARGGDRGEGFFDGAEPGVEKVGGTEVHVLPTLDGRGRLYDVGQGAEEEDDKPKPGNRRPKKEKFETRDSKTGELLRYNADDDSTTLADLVRAERFGAGQADQKSLDAEMAMRIATDGRYKNEHDYLDENAEVLARKKMRTDAMKRQFAIKDFARTKKALDECSYCWQDEGAKPPRAAVVASGTRVYLAVPDHEPLVEGHCLIVPIQHHLSTLEAEDDTWDEIKNFMKCLMRMFAAKQQGVLFWETVLSLRKQRHTYIEAVPVPWDMFQDMPAYFKEGLMSVGQEWSTHLKVIDFAARGGFRRSLVPNLPYFMVHWDHAGLKGYGHVIESGANGDGEDGTAGGDDDEARQTRLGGDDFPRWFAAEIVGGRLDLEPRRWRNPRRLRGDAREEVRRSFQAAWKEWDWTKLIGADGAEAQGSAA